MGWSWPPYACLSACNVWWGKASALRLRAPLISRPKLLLADEPTGNVDPILARRLLRLFVELHRSGTSIVIATHDTSLMDQIEARRIVLNDGTLYIYD